MVSWSLYYSKINIMDILKFIPNYFGNKFNQIVNNNIE